MPISPPELVVEFSIEPFLRGEKDPGDQIEAAKAAAETSGLAQEAGPKNIALAGEREEVLQALYKVIEASLDAGAKTVQVKLEVPVEVL